MEGPSVDLSRSARIARRLASGGVKLPDARETGFAIDFTRLLLTIAAPSVDELPTRRGPILDGVVERTGLPREVAERVLALAEEPEFRAGVSKREMSAFVARFGKLAGERLEERESADIDVSAFARVYGGEQALLLLDAAVKVLTATGVISRAAIRQLEDAADRLGIDAVLFWALLQKHDPDLARGEWTEALPASPAEGERGAEVTLGRSLASNIVLPDAQVAPLHAALHRDGNGWRVKDLSSGRPTVLNDEPVKEAPFARGQELRIGPFRLALDETGSRLQVTSRRSFSALSCRNLQRRIGQVSLLDDLSFTVFSGEVVAMIGPSGCGKTTLLNAIAGVTPADTGTVRLDGRDFHAELRAERESVGIVPQDDIVHPELTVAESLYFGAKLRLPPGTSDAEVGAEVTRVLGELGIEHIRHSRIGDALRRGISGGQRKRVNLGQELLARSTRVLFLDEPTSGLDPRASQDIVRLVRQLADRGRIVFVVTHDLSPQVIAQVDHLMVLVPGGRLAFFGPPAEACAYFGVRTPDAIFNCFSDRPAAEWGEAWRKSDDARTYVAMREQLLTLRSADASTRSEVPPRPPAKRSGWAQVHTLLRRYARVKGRDLGGLAVLALQAPVLAAVMAIVFPVPTREMMFMLSLSCMWFGMSASVRELISDRVIWLRERRIGVRAAPYVWSKVWVLSALVGAQCAAFALMNLALHPIFFTSYHVDQLAFMGNCALTGLVGMALGLLISAINSSSEGAVGMLPLLLIPQIAFSGVLLRLTRMTDFAFRLTDFNPARYGFDGLLKTMEKLGNVPQRGTGWESLELHGHLYNLGFAPSSIMDNGLSPLQIVGRLVGFAVVFLGGTLIAIWRRRE